MASCGSAVGKKVWALKDMEIEREKREAEKSEKPETKKPKLMIDNKVVEIEYEDEDASPDVLYDRESTDDVPDKLFTDMVELAIRFFKNRYPQLQCSLVNLVKVTSVVCCGVQFTLTMTAKVPGLCKDDFLTLESTIWSKGALADSRVLYTKHLW